MFWFLCRAADIDTLRILVATDCHVGYLENDEIRRYDSFNAFEEICSIAAQRQVWGSSYLPLVILCFIHCSGNWSIIKDRLPVMELVSCYSDYDQGYIVCEITWSLRV